MTHCSPLIYIIKKGLARESKLFFIGQVCRPTRLTCFVLLFILVFSYILLFNLSNRFVKKIIQKFVLLNTTEFLIFFNDIITFFIVLENTLFIQPFIMFFLYRKYFICSLSFIECCLIKNHLIFCLFSRKVIALLFITLADTFLQLFIMIFFYKKTLCCGFSMHVKFYCHMVR